MSTTTQILFNSPALNSLKRDQLVKLCKIHSLRATGKNRELIERLQLHAKTLPPSDPLSIAIRSENVDAKPTTDSEDDESNHAPPADSISRPSEQWEVVMDTITEVDEETLRSNRGGSDRQIDEFGTRTSKASVTSSLKAIATSLGLKRTTSKTVETSSSSSSLSSKEAQSSSTLPTSDPNGECDVEPVPGQSNLPGSPAPAEARLSLSHAPTTTTIRLVSNPTTNSDFLLSPPKLEPFATSFDLLPGSPRGAGTTPVPVWPFSPGGATRESLYPSIPTFDDMTKQQSPFTQCDNSDMDLDVDMPGGLAAPSVGEPAPVKAISLARFNTGATPKSIEKPRVGPVDIFSPVPNPQNASKLGIPRSGPFVFGSPLPQTNTTNLQFRTAAQSVLEEMNKRLAEEGIEAVDANVLNGRRTGTSESTEKRRGNGLARAGDMFDKIHQKEFDKMDSITSHYAAKRGVQDGVAQPILSKKRKSSLVVKERISGVPTARHRPNGSRVASGNSVKIPSGDMGEEGDEDDDADRRLSKRPRVEQGESGTPAQKTSLPPPPDPEEEARKQKEREAVRRRLEHNKAKRRSSMGRPSLGRTHPPKQTRFGFLASAKSLVQSVWNRGAGSKAQSSIPVTKPAQPKEVTKPPPKPTDAKKPSVIARWSGAPPVGPQTSRKASDESSNPVLPGRSTLAPPVISGETGSIALSFRNRNPSTASNTIFSRKPTSTTIAGHGPSKNSRMGSLIGFSSLGGKPNLSRNDTPLSTRQMTNVAKPTSGIPRARTSSTLMAPTASSLAKMNSLVRHAEEDRSGRRSPNGTLDEMRSPPGRVTTGVFRRPAASPGTGTVLSTMAAGTPKTVAVGTPKATTVAGSTPKTRVVVTATGRRPRISRSKVIARLASQRAAVTSTSTRIGRAGGKVRSSMGAEVAGKQSCGGGARADVLKSAKRRVRQSEQARRRSRVAVGSDQEGTRMDVDM